MSTNQQVVDRAAQELGYIEYGAALDATDGADAMRDLNNMMAGWAVSDRDLNFFPQDTLSEVCPLPPWAEGSVISALAISLGAVFNVEPSRSTYTKGRDGEKLVTRTLINLNLKPADMRHMPQGRVSGRNILTDT